MYHLHTSLSSYFLTEAPTCLSVDIIFFDSENGRNTKKIKGQEGNNFEHVIRSVNTVDIFFFNLGVSKGLSLKIGAY